jgi:hypothetical protein
VWLNWSLRRWREPWRGEGGTHLRTRSVPVVDGWPLLSDEWLTTGVGLTLNLVCRCRLRPSSCCCRWRTGAKGLQPWGAFGRWRDK